VDAVLLDSPAVFKPLQYKNMLWSAASWTEWNWQDVMLSCA